MDPQAAGAGDGAWGRGPAEGVGAEGITSTAPSSKQQALDAGPEGARGWDLERERGARVIGGGWEGSWEGVTPQQQALGWGLAG